jgi:hydrogenase-4 component F
MLAALFWIPTIGAILTLMLRISILRRLTLVVSAAAHTAVTATVWFYRPGPILHGWFAIDEVGLLCLILTSLLFLTAAVYAFGYLKAESDNKKKEDFIEHGVFFTNSPEGIFIACLLAFLATMTLVTVSQHLGLLWVAMEATTLATAPLIYYHRHHRSLEATWKYLLICSVGIALALLGTFFLAAAASTSQNQPASLVLADLLTRGPQMNIIWLKAAFILLLVGYGTKMGLAPLHTWLPDAHSEAPSVVSALLSGALLNCAFLAVLRAFQVCMTAGLGDFCRELLVLFGLVSIGWAAIFIPLQTDYKRMLAYSSIEHMGIICMGVGIGAGAVFGSMLHMVNHSLTKGMLFMAAGTILAAYQTKIVHNVKGLRYVLPITGLLWMAGFLAITGVPPFGLFISEFIIAKTLFGQGRFIAASAYLAFLALIFIGMSRVFLNMSHGRPPANKIPVRETVYAVAGPVLLGLITLVLGLYIPSPLRTLLESAAEMLGGF